MSNKHALVYRGSLNYVEGIGKINFRWNKATKKK